MRRIMLYFMEKTNVSPELTAFFEALAAIQEITSVIEYSRSKYPHATRVAPADRANRARWELWRRLPPLIGSPTIQ